MENSNKVLLGSLAVVIMGAFAISSAMAHQGDYSKQGPTYSPERHTAMTEAMDSNNYEAWRELMTDRGRITQVINADNFEQFAEARRLAHNGDLEGADDIRKELGLRTRNGEKVGAGYGEKQGRGRMNLR
ncbi:MAG: hypothetical protein KAQ87_04860 [Candidatus Pacebacteria bacterium]|nr:hypothetical protein [Candidatus Paceibacterota bacterium]